MLFDFFRHFKEHFFFNETFRITGRSGFYFLVVKKIDLFIKRLPKFIK
jgi:hypothetical protein